MKSPLVFQRGFTIIELLIVISIGAILAAIAVPSMRDMLNTTDKSFGERAARKFEEAAQLPRLWLDQIDADMALATPATTARETRPNMPPAGWPWSAELWAAVLRLDEDQAAHAEAVLRAHLSLGG